MSVISCVLDVSLISSKTLSPPLASSPTELRQPSSDTRTLQQGDIVVQARKNEAFHDDMMIKNDDVFTPHNIAPNK